MKRIFCFFTILLTIILLSTDALQAQGGHWKRLIAAPTFEVWVNPLNYRTIFVGGGGRVVYRSYDQGSTWDTLTIEYRNATAQLNNLFIHPIDTNVVIVGGLLFGDIRRSTDQGNTWEIVLQKDYSIALNGKALVMKPDDPNILYIGEFNKGIVWRSTDRGITWDSISRVKTIYHIKDSLGNIIRDTILPITIGSLSIRDDSTNILIANSTAGEVFMSKDGGITWKFMQALITPILEPQDCEITRLDFSNRDPRCGYSVITYLFAANKNNGGLYKTTDGGYSWSPLAFPDTSLWAVAVREYKGEDEVFIGGFTVDFYTMESLRVPGVGVVRRSQDGGKTWYNYDNYIDWVYYNYQNKATFRHIDIVDFERCFAVGDFGLLYFTPNSGVTWNKLGFVNRRMLYSIHFPTDSIGYTVGEYGTVLRSTSRGIYWDTLYLGNNENLYGVYFLDINHGFVAGDRGGIYETTNGGTSWQKKNSNTTNHLWDIHFTNSMTGYAVGDDGTFLKSTDGGQNWSTKDLGTSEPLESISFIDSSKAFIAGGNGLILKTENEGNTWNTVQKVINDSLHSIYFADGQIGYAVGDNGAMIKTEDGGDTWFELQRQVKHNLMSVGFMSRDTGVVAGVYRTLMVTTDGGRNWSHEMWGISPIANMWSLRYFGDLGKEKLYMASEAGLFVLDEPSPVQEQIPPPARGSLTVTNDRNDLLRIRYSPRIQGLTGKVDFKMINILGQSVLRAELMLSGAEVLDSDINISNIPRGMYICLVFEHGHYATCKVIVE